MHCDRFYFVHRIQFSQLNDYTSSEVALKSEVRAHNALAYLSHRYETVSVDDAKPSTLSPSEMTTDPKLQPVVLGGGGITVHVPVAFRNKCERVTGPQPERVRSIFAGVNATRTSGTGPEREPEQV